MKIVLRTWCSDDVYNPLPSAVVTVDEGLRERLAARMRGLNTLRATEPELCEGTFTPGGEIAFYAEDLDMGGRLSEEEYDAYQDNGVALLLENAELPPEPARVELLRQVIDVGCDPPDVKWQCFEKHSQPLIETPCLSLGLLDQLFEQAKGGS